MEYDPRSEEVVIYDYDYISNHLGKLVGDPDITVTDKTRSLRSFDDYLVLGYSRGLMRFDGDVFSVINTGSNVLYINKTKDGKILFDQTKGLFVVDDDFTTVTEIPTEKNVTGNRLKFLVDGDNHSRLIAENMGMQPDDVENIYYIALLHDIGKIAIPDSILNKPGRLTDEEFKVMKSHTTRGAEILKGISTIPQIIEGAKSHHERYDGSGYPEGLSGENIPFAARIICCADCFDAMASRRVYKEPFSQDVIIKEFERCSGTQFDPVISKIVIGMIASGKLKPYSADDIYLGSDGKTHRIKKASENQQDI